MSLFIALNHIKHGQMYFFQKDKYEFEDINRHIIPMFCGVLDQNNNIY